MKYSYSNMIPTLLYGILRYNYSPVLVNSSLKLTTWQNKAAIVSCPKRICVDNIYTNIAKIAACKLLQLSLP